MSAKHTMGPWKNGLDRDGKPIIFQHASQFTPPDEICPEFIANLRLLDAAPDLLALAHQYAEECAECGGTALIWARPADPQDTKKLPCPQCADIWAVIDKAEGRA